MTSKFPAGWLLIAVILSACSSPRATAPAAPVAPDSGNPALKEAIEKMAGIGYATGPRFSPDGKQVVYLAPAEGSPQVFSVNVDGTDRRQLTRFDDQVRGVEWSPEDSALAVSLAPGGGLNTQLYLLDDDGSNPIQITEGGNTNNWLGFFSQDGRYLAYSSNAAGDGNMHCYLHDRMSGTSRLIARNSGIGSVAALSPTASKAVIWRMRSRGNTDLYLLDLASGQEQLLTDHQGVAVSNDARFFDDNTLLLSTNVGRETVALARIDIDAEGIAGPLRVIAGRPDAELSAFEVVDDETAALIWNVGGRSELGYFNLDRESPTTNVRLPAEIVTAMDVAPESGDLVLSVTGSTAPQDVWLLDNNSARYQRLSNTDTNGVNPGTLVRPQLLQYTAHDGLGLSGWLYRPKQWSAAGPLVLSFHGGPEGQERPFFRPTYQALVSQGIAVFAPNVRGSAGFGKRFVNLDNGRLRFDAVADIQSTAQFVIDQGIAEPGRLGIMGGSYGGYMVMAGLTEYPDLFAAGANLFGIVNFQTFFAETEAWMAAISKVEYGDPDTEAELLRQLSPIYKLDRVRAPTLVLHGANDTNVPVVEAEQVVDRLKQQGVPVRYVLFPDEGHGWRKTENRVTSDLEIVSWFTQYLQLTESKD